MQTKFFFFFYLTLEPNINSVVAHKKRAPRGTSQGPTLRARPHAYSTGYSALARCPEFGSEPLRRLRARAALVSLLAFDGLWDMNHDGRCEFAVSHVSQGRCHGARPHANANAQ